MIGYLVSLLVGLAGWRGLRRCSGAVPAPPLIALIGLLGMVLGEQAIDLASAPFRISPKGSIEQPPSDFRGPR
jgi:XapX domain-containing protein